MAGCYISVLTQLEPVWRDFVFFLSNSGLHRHHHQYWRPSGMCSFPTGGRKLSLHQRAKPVRETCIDSTSTSSRSEYKRLEGQVEVTMDFRRSLSQSSMEQCLGRNHLSSWEPQFPQNSNIDLVRKRPSRGQLPVGGSEVFSQLLRNTALLNLNVYLHIHFPIFLFLCTTVKLPETRQENLIILFLMQWNVLGCVGVAQSETPTFTPA